MFDTCRPEVGFEGLREEVVVDGGAKKRKPQRSAAGPGPRDGPAPFRRIDLGHGGPPVLEVPSLYVDDEKLVPFKSFGFLAERRFVKGVEDVGGRSDDPMLAADIPMHEHDEPDEWELKANWMVSQCFTARLINFDEHRRAMEMMPKELYYATSYFEKWIVGLAIILTEKGTVKQKDLDSYFGNDKPVAPPLFHVGEAVRVRAEDTQLRWRKPHLRTPGYIFGCTGRVERVMQPNTTRDGWISDQVPEEMYAWFKSPMLASFGNESKAIARHLYRVRFLQHDVWPEAFPSHCRDTLDVEIFEDWLVSPGAEAEADAARKPPSYKDDAPIVWDGQWKLVKSRKQVEEAAVKSERNKHGPLRDFAEAFCDFLLNRAVVAVPGVGPVTEAMFQQQRPGMWATFQAWPAKLGAYMVARAWSDAGFRALLLTDGNAAAVLAVQDLQKDGRGDGNFFGAQGFSTKLVVHENTETDHHVFVCTMCSCYPTLILGQAPGFFKSLSYRAQVVRNPRGVLQKHFGLSVPTSVSVHCHDSNAECRYLILPRRPDHTEGWDVSELEKLVTRNCMIGVGWPLAAEQKPQQPWPQSLKAGQTPYYNGHLMPGALPKCPYDAWAQPADSCCFGQLFHRFR